jgi:ankyrin repeat protein
MTCIGGEYGPSLVAAAFKKNCDVVSMLLESGANTNLVDKNGWTALHHVANSSHENKLPCKTDQMFAKLRKECKYLC